MAFSSPLKIILPSNYPMGPPRIYFDMQMQKSVIDALPYVNKQTMMIEPDSVKNWRSTFTLDQVVTETSNTIAFNPPNSGQPPVQHQAAWGGQVAASQPSQQQQFQQQQYQPQTP